ncbi:MAG TPA: hypothetical protein VGE74_07400 [Gemmata sp.]
MRHFIFATAAALAFAAVPSPANAQIVIYNSNFPSAPGVRVINTPPFYSGLAFNNGVITAFPAGPRFGYPAFGYPYAAPYYGYPSYPNRYPFTPGGYTGHPPGPWRP